MKSKGKTKRIREIEEVYKTLGLQSEKAQKYFFFLSSVPTYEKEGKKISVFIEADTVSHGTGAFSNAGLESNS